jgi:hypothetical protein
MTMFIMGKGRLPPRRRMAPAEESDNWRLQEDQGLLCDTTTRVTLNLKRETLFFRCGFTSPSPKSLKADVQWDARPDPTPSLFARVMQPLCRQAKLGPHAPKSSHNCWYRVLELYDLYWSVFEVKSPETHDVMAQIGGRLISLRAGLQ